MIDKKAFRVTNEQAKKDLIRECEDHCHVCEFDKPCREVESYAADLLDARELIDKQEALIKEMREGIQDLKRFHVNTLENGRDRIVSLGGLCDSVEDMERGDRLVRNANAILDKTKDYAE